MKRYLRLITMFFKLSLARMIVYKSDFIIWSLVAIGWTILMLVFYEILFLNVQSVGGWSKGEVLLLQGFYFILEFVMWGLLWENMREIPEKINKGSLDIDLVKPVNLQFMLSVKHISLDNLNNLILGLVTIAYGVSLAEITLTAGGILLSFISVIGASLLIYSLWFITMCAAFWFDRFENLHYLFPSLRQFWKMPQSFYQGGLKIAFTFILPIALVTTVPAEFIIGRNNWPFLAVLLISGVVAFLVSRQVFKIALRHYAGASA